MVVVRQKQHVLASSVDEFGWQYQEVGPNRIQSGVEILFGQTEPLEPMHQIVSEEQDLKEGDIGYPVLGGDLAQGIVVEQFADVFLDGGALGVKRPDPPRMGLQVGDQDVVSILAIFEKGQLLGLHRVLGNRPTHHDEPMRALPVQRLVAKLSHFPRRLASS